MRIRESQDALPQLKATRPDSAEELIRRLPTFVYDQLLNREVPDRRSGASMRVCPHAWESLIERTWKLKILASRAGLA